MGSIAKRPNGQWRARYRDPDGKEHARHFERKADAQRWITDNESKKLRGDWVDPDDRTTVSEYARRWAAARPHRPTTARWVDALIRLHLDNTALGSRRLVAVRTSDVQAWVTGMAQRMAPTSVQHNLTYLRTIFAAAVRDRLVASSPVIGIALPKVERERVVPLTVEQVRALADEVPERNRAMVIAQAGLGLRVSELLALRAEDVDFLRRTARVEHQIGEHRERVEPKTPRSRRTVPLPTFVAEALAEHMRRWTPLASGELFWTRGGRPYISQTYAKVFRPAVHRLAAAPGSTFPADTTSHALRHHYASVLLAGGESVVAVAERLGHENATMVLSVYGHLMGDSAERTRRVVDDAWSTGGPGVLGVAMVIGGADPRRTTGMS